MPLQIRRGTQSEANSLAVPPQAGELIYVTDAQQLYVGDGTTLLADLTPITGYTDENALDKIGTVLSSGSHTGISFTFNDAADTITATINPSQSLTALTVTGTSNLSTTNITGNLTVSGLLTADYKGSIFADDSTVLVNAVDAKIELDGTVKGNIIPDNNEAYDIGSASKRFKDIYLSGSSIYLGNAQIVSSGTTVNLPAGSTVDGEPLGGGGAPGSNLNVNIVGDDSTILVDSSLNILRGTLVGELQGSVFGDQSTQLIDGVEGNIVGPVVNSTINTGLLTIGQDLAAGGLVINTESSLDDDYDLFTINSFHSDSVSSSATFFRARGTQASPGSLTTNDEIFTWLFAAQGAAGPTQAGQIIVSVDGALTGGGNFTPGKIEFKTADSAGNPQAGISVDSIQTTILGGALQLKVFADDSARSSAIASPTKGMMIFMEAGTTPAATNQVQIFDGSNWVNL